MSFSSSRCFKRVERSDSCKSKEAVGEYNWDAWFSIPGSKQTRRRGVGGRASASKRQPLDLVPYNVHCDARHFGWVSSFGKCAHSKRKFTNFLTYFHSGRRPLGEWPRGPQRRIFPGKQFKLWHGPLGSWSLGALLEGAALRCSLRRLL